jgi:AcrR family transcriptional regulator
MSDPVKGKTEAGRRREERAHRTRARVAEAALRLFLKNGYLATTVEAIAREAGVAPATVYQAFGTKQAVLARALDTTIVGDAAAVALLDRDWVAAARRQRSARRRIESVVRQAAQVAARTAPLKEVMRDAAATDPQVRALIREDHRRRRATHRALVELALEGTSRSSTETLDRATDAFFMLVHSDNYVLATEILGWTDEEWQRWLIAMLTPQLLDDSAG